MNRIVEGAVISVPQVDWVPRPDWVNTAMNRIVFSTEARGLQRMTPAERRQQDDMRSVVLAQPHRRGDESREVESALGRLCKRMRWHGTCFEAGLMYGENLRQYRLAQGFYVPGIYGSSLFGDSDAPEVRLERYRLKVKVADEVLREVKLRMPMVIGELCYYDRDASSNDEFLIGSALVKLALHYGLRKFFHEPGYAGDGL